ncbi:MAG TPA: hypothetical protein VM261_10965 [Kofleriaceae bacterium]|nr:hypothetical protein [Kofleriaceae bacterium]
MRATAAVVLLAAVACGEVTVPRKPGVAPAAAASPSVELVPGVIMDRAGRTVYASTSDGHLVAIDVTTGKERWTSYEAARPLLLTPLGVLAQRDSEGATERLDLALVESQEGKLASGCEPVRIAAWARAQLWPDETQEFQVRARASVEGRPVVEWRARAKQPVAGVNEVNDAGVPVLPEASGWGLLDPSTCAVIELGPLGPEAAPWEPPGRGPVTVDGVTAEIVIAPGAIGQVAALRRTRGGETLPDVPLAADLDVSAKPLWSADRAYASVTAAEPGRGRSEEWGRWVVAGVADGVPFATIFVSDRPRGFQVTPAGIVVVLADEIAAFDRDGKQLWARGVRGVEAAAPSATPAAAPR